MQTIILPKGQAVYEDLQTSCVHMGNMLQSLEEENFSGYIELRSDRSQGVIFFGMGEVINAFFQNGRSEEKTIGQDAITLILNESKSKHGMIKQCRFSADIIKVLATLASNEVVYNNLSTDFISIEKIIDNLGARKLTGYMELEMLAKLQIAVIFFQEGRPVECVFCSLTTGEVRSGIGILDSIVKHALKVGADINIYKGALQPSTEKLEAVPSPDMKEVILFLEVSFNIINSTLSKHSGGESFEEAFTDACINPNVA